MGLLLVGTSHQQAVQHCPAVEPSMQAPGSLPTRRISSGRHCFLPATPEFASARKVGPMNIGPRFFDSQAMRVRRSRANVANVCFDGASPVCMLADKSCKKSSTAVSKNLRQILGISSVLFGRTQNIQEPSLVRVGAERAVVNSCNTSLTAPAVIKAGSAALASATLR